MKENLKSQIEEKSQNENTNDNNSRLPKGPQKVNILSNIMPERVELERPGGQTDHERIVQSENRFSAELDPESAGDPLLVVDGGNGGGLQNRRHRRGRRRIGSGIGGVMTRREAERKE